MYLLIAVLAMLAAPQVIGGFSEHILPPMARWGWWTVHVYSVGVAAIYHPYGEAHWKAVGVVSITLFFLSYPLFWTQYLEMMPASPEGLHWATVFAVVNVLLPVGLAAAGPMIPVIRRREGQA